MSEDFPPLKNGGNRPVIWDYSLYGVEGQEGMTNVVTIYLNPNRDFDESGRHPDREFSSVTVTREELRQMLACLDEDVDKFRTYCPDGNFV